LIARTALKAALSKSTACWLDSSRFWRRRVDSKSTVCHALAISLIVSFISSFMVSLRLSPVMAGRGMIRDSHAGWVAQLGWSGRFACSQHAGGPPVFSF
jgi:hypothetical protein